MANTNPLVTPIPVVPKRTPMLDWGGDASRVPDWAGKAVVDRVWMLFFEQIASAALIGPIIGFTINDGSTTAYVPTYPAVRTGYVDELTLVVGTSDGGTDLIFKILQNGLSIFSPPGTITVPAGTAAGKVLKFTDLTANPLPVSQDDKFTLVITSGTSNWKFVTALETAGD